MSFRKYATGEVIPPEDVEQPEPEPTEADRLAMSHVDRADLDYAGNDRPNETP